MHGGLHNTVKDYEWGTEMKPASVDDGAIRDQLVKLMDSYEEPLYNFLVVLLGDRELSYDCAQDTFLRAYQNLVSGKPVTAQWLYTVARNRAMDHFRQRRKIWVNPLDEHADLVDALPDRELEGAVRRALAQLSPSDREILYLAHTDGLKPREIAQTLGIRAGTMRMRLLRAHQRFRAVYQDEP